MRDTKWQQDCPNTFAKMAFSILELGKNHGIEMELLGPVIESCNNQGLYEASDLAFLEIEDLKEIKNCNEKTLQFIYEESCKLKEGWIKGKVRASGVSRPPTESMPPIPKCHPYIPDRETPPP